MIPILELKSQYVTIKKEIDAAVFRVLDRQNFILGEEVDMLEKEIAIYCESQYAVGCSSGTDALMLALMAIGVGSGDEVITTPYTFFSTSSAIVRLGATPVYVDINDLDFNINPLEIEQKITEKTKAILPVHFAGHMCNMDKIMEVAGYHNLAVIEDCAQAIGATYHGKKAGTIGDIGCISFYPSKNLGAYGDAGMCVTDHVNLASKMRMLRNHGQDPKYYHLMVGGNFRMDEIQAAVLRVKLFHLDEWIDLRRANANRYIHSFIESNTPVVLPYEYTGQRHTYHLFVLRTNNRDYVMHKLKESGVGSGIYYPLPLHLQPCFEHLGYNIGDFPNAEKSALDNFAIPVYPELTDKQIDFVIDVIRDAL